MIQRIVNNSQTDVQMSTFKAENSQESGNSFAEVIAQAFVSRHSIDSASPFANNNFLAENEEISNDSDTKPDILSLILLNNNIMHLLKNNHNLAESQINEFMNENNLETIDIEQLKEVFDGIKAAYHPENNNSFSISEFQSGGELQANNLFPKSKETADNIQSANNILNSDIKITADNIQSANNILNSEIKITADNIQSANNILNSEIKITADNIQSENNTLNSGIKNTADNIKSDNNILNTDLKMPIDIQDENNIEQTKAAVKTEISINNSESDKQSSTLNIIKDNLQLSKAAEDITKNLGKTETPAVQPKTESNDNINQGNSQFNSRNGEEQQNSSQNQRNDLEYEKSSNVNKSEFKKQNETYSKLPDNTKLQAAFAAGADGTSELSEGKTISSAYDKFARINIRELPRFIDRTIKAMPSDSIHQARLILEPANLGRVSVQITLSGNSAQISFKADNAETVKVLESQLSGLKDKLSAGGIKVESASVEYRNSDSNSSQMSKDNNSQANHSREDEQTRRQYLNILNNNITNAKTKEFSIPNN